jgi:hypothetical protein
MTNFTTQKCLAQVGAVCVGPICANILYVIQGSLLSFRLPPKLKLFSSHEFLHFVERFKGFTTTFESSEYHSNSLSNQNKMSTMIIERQWQCRSRDQQFDSKGKRDAHHRKEPVTTHSGAHQQQRTIRSTTKKFDCPSGKKFSLVQSLQRHCKTCQGGIFKVETADDS